MLNRTRSKVESFAFDRASARTYDVDGRLHVSITNLSKANICEYLGREVPGYEELGLGPSKIYKAYRHPEELRKAVPTFNNLPLLSRHVPVSADEHHPNLVVGSTGTDASFEAPFLRNSLVIWSRDAIQDVEQEDKRELSAGYRYTPDFTSGKTPEGEEYDFVMRDIVGNHISLVERGRAGPDVVVADSADPLQWELLGSAVEEFVWAALGQAVIASAGLAHGVYDSPLNSVSDANLSRLV